MNSAKKTSPHSTILAYGVILPTSGTPWSLGDPPSQATVTPHETTPSHLGYILQNVPAHSVGNVHSFHLHQSQHCKTCSWRSAVSESFHQEVHEPVHVNYMYGLFMYMCIACMIVHLRTYMWIPCMIFHVRTCTCELHIIIMIVQIIYTWIT